MAMRQRDEYDEFGNAIAPTDPLLNTVQDQGGAGGTYDRGIGGRFGITDPQPVATAPPVNQNPYFDPGTNITPGVDIPLAGKATSTGTVTPPPAAPAGRMDDTAIMAQIAQWAKMDGADPSLGNDPGYWLNAIKSRDGLGPDNLQYWQNAGVGPTAFFRNPGRETAGAARTGGSGVVSPPAAPPAAASGPTFVGQAPSTGNSDFLNQFQAAMLKQLQALNDPAAAQQNAQPAIDAHRVSSERGLADENNGIAESLYARNPGLLHSGALDTLKQQARERATNSQATFAGNAVMSQNALRQQALSSLLGLGSNQLTSANGLGLGYAGLNSADSHFNDQMGFNYANLGQNANYQAMLLALQGAGGGGL